MRAVLSEATTQMAVVETGVDNVTVVIGVDRVAAGTSACEGKRCGTLGS